MKKVGNVFSYVITALIVLFGAILLLGAFAPGGFAARVVLSGSMEPTIPTGSVVFTLTRDTYSSGDVITFRNSADAKIPTTHRIVEVSSGPLGDLYTTKGDANDVDDFTSVRQKNVLGKVLLHIPYLGYILDFAKKPFGFVLLIGVPAVLLIFEEGKKIWQEIKKVSIKKEEAEPEVQTETTDL